MALMNGIKKQEGSRSKTHLIKSGHASPASDFVLDRIFLYGPAKTETVTDEKIEKFKTIWNDGVLFNYQFGGPGVSSVVIPQGRLVGVNAPQFNFLDQVYKTPISLPGLIANKNVVGMVPYNICKDALELDQFGGNKPTAVTQEYVVLPYMPGTKPSTEYTLDGVLDEEERITVQEKMPWGALIGEIKTGEKVMATPSGRCTKYDESTGQDPIGRVWEMDLNQESWGWLKWMLMNPAEADKSDKMINRSGTSSLPSDGGYPYNFEYRDGDGIYEVLNAYQSKFVSNPTGMEGLHDGTGNYEGFGRNETVYKDMDLGVVPEGIVDGAMVVFQAVDYVGNKAKNIIKESLELKLDETVIDAEKITVNEKLGTIAVVIDSATESANKKVTATYKMKHYGTPSYLDFRGVVGSVSILLQM